MAQKPEGGEVRLRSVERAAASAIEGHSRTLPEASGAQLTGQGFHQERRGGLGVGGPQPDRGELPCSACLSGYGGFPYALVRYDARDRGFPRIETGDSRGSRRRRCRPRRDDDRGRRRDDRRDRRGDESVDWDRDRRRDDRRRSERA